MVDHKPLPALPALTTLSIDARQHRSQLIRAFLSEIREAWIETKRNAWLHVFEEALDELGEALSEGKWLEGVRKLREQQRDWDLKRRETVKARKKRGASFSENGEEGSEAEQSWIPAAMSVAGVKHLFLCVAPPVQSEDELNIGCSFKAGTYALQDTETPTILFGSNEGSTAQMVGGTFTFKGLSSSDQHSSLFRALRLSIYVQLSLTLEQQLLIDSSITLVFPRPRLTLSFPSAPQRPTAPLFPPPIEYKAGKKYTSQSFIRSLFPFKSTHIHRATTIVPLSREPNSSPRSSFDFRFSILGSGGTKHSTAVLPSPPSSPHAPTHANLTNSELNSHPNTDKDKDTPTKTKPTFTQALTTLHTNAALLSTSPGVRFAPPPLIVELAEREHKHPGGGVRKLRGDERAGLGSILGWEGISKEKETLVGGMIGSIGFVRQQGIEVLVSSHVPGVLPDSQDGEARLTCGRARWRSFRYYSYAGGSRREEDGGELDWEDETLGGALRRFSEEYSKQCAVQGCKYPRGEHEVRIVHGGVRVSICVSLEGGEEETEGEGRIEMWVSCALCGASSEKRGMSDGSFLLSFAKFIELLIYSPTLAGPSPAVCTCSPSSTNRFSFRRHFSVPPSASAPDHPKNKDKSKDMKKHKHVVTFACSTVDDIFELRVPRLQMKVPSYDRGERTERSVYDSGSGCGSVETMTNTEEGEEGEGEKEKRELRREIRMWWEGVGRHLDRLASALADDDDSSEKNLKTKALPRIPSIDDVNEYSDFDVESSIGTSLEVSGLPFTRRSAPAPMAKDTEHNHGKPIPSLLSSSSPTSSSTTSSTSSLTPTPTYHPLPSPSVPTPSTRLTSLRASFQRIEHSLYVQLTQTHTGRLNDVRRAFVCAARGAERRVGAWEGKYLPVGVGEGAKGDKERREASKEREVEPGWWSAGCHVLPGSSVLVDEKDWGSVIAFTLSTTDYQRELNCISIARQASSTNLHAQPHSQQQPQPIPIPQSPQSQPPSMNNTPTLSTHSNHSSSFFTAAAIKLFPFSTTTNPAPDPDTDDPAWTDPEELFSAVVSRKQHPREASLLSIREVLRQQQRSPAPGSGSGTPGGEGSRFGSVGRAFSPWAKPDVGISRDEADGVVSVGAGAGREGSEAVERILLSLECESGGAGVGMNGETVSRPVSSAGEQDPVVDQVGDFEEKEKLKKRFEVGGGDEESVKSDRTVGKGPSASVVKEREEEVAPPPPPKDEGHMPLQEMKRDVSNARTASSFASTLTSGLNNAMRFMLNSNSGSNASECVRSGSPFSHHGLLSLEAAGIDDRPHIKFDWTVGKRLKFSCTVYYAKQFACLRRRCGVDDGVFVSSLRKSKNWDADGGKSRSNFWKTEDERFVIKTLVDAWNVADLQVLIDLAPSYFRYMDGTAKKATVLAKMMGFYTIEIRNLETGNIQSKADLLVMENLFFRQTISKTFDLKGIQGRKVKPSNASKVAQKSKTLFDGEWIEGQQKALMLVRPHSKQVLRAAIRSDADFLAKSNIMDYSLLVGVDEEHKQIACGLVDTIGSYTFAKTLEYKAKHGLKSGKEITVIPPAEYQERFVGTLEGYFLACPDKWSKPADESNIIGDMNLPSVL